MGGQGYAGLCGGLGGYGVMIRVVGLWGYGGMGVGGLWGYEQKVSRQSFENQSEALV